MKIPFDIKFRPQIESGEYKVETFSGYPVTIYRWDFNDGEQTSIMGSYIFEDGKEYVGAWNEEGHFDLMSPNDLDLFLVTPEPELSEFENKLRVICEDAVRESQLFPERTSEDFAKKHSAELLELARKELFANDTVLKEYAETSRVQGKVEALKDLPRWGSNIKSSMVDKANVIGQWLYYKEHRIRISDLEKLPGFNE